MPELPHRNIDTGMGLERIAAIMQHKGSNYDGDVLRDLIGVGEALAKLRYHQNVATDRSLRILADHSRAVTFMIADGILPSNVVTSCAVCCVVRSTTAGSWAFEVASSPATVMRSYASWPTSIPS